MSRIVSGILPAKSKGIIFRDKHSGRDLNCWLTRSPILISPGYRVAEESSMRQDGVHRDVLGLDKATITCSFVLLANGETNIRKDYLDRLSSWLTPRKGESKLILDTRPDRYYLANRSEQAIKGAIRSGLLHFDVDFVASSPFMWDALETPLELNKDKLTGSIVNKGNIESYYSIEVRAITSLTQVTFTFGGSNRRILIKLPNDKRLLAGDVLYLDAENVRAVIVRKTGKTDNVLQHTNLGFSVLPEGTTSVAATSDDATSKSSLLAKIYPKSRWE